MQVLISWAQHHGTDPGPWRLLVCKEGYSEPPIGVFSDTTAADVLPPPYRRNVYTPAQMSEINASIVFRGMELPAALAPLRLAACEPVKRARAEAIDEVLTKFLEPSILPFALGEPLEIARVAVVAKPWAAGVRGWFGADQWLKVWGLSKYFTTPAHIATALPILKAIERPSPELGATVGKVYEADVTERLGGMLGEMETQEGLSIRFGKLDGLPYTFLWRYVFSIPLSFPFPCLIADHSSRHPPPSSATAAAPTPWRATLWRT